MKTKLMLASLRLAFSAAMLLLLLPTGVAGYDGVRRTTTLLHQGSWAIVASMLPVVFALLPLIFPKQAIRIIAAILIGIPACVSDSTKFRDALR